VWKLGGIYMDLDMVSIDSMEEFFKKHLNFITPESDATMNNCFFGFEKGNTVLLRIMKALDGHYDPAEYLSGSLAVNEALEAMARDKIAGVIQKQAIGKLHIPFYKFASPVNSSHFEYLFNEEIDGDVFWNELSDSSACHFWSHKSSLLPVYTNSSSPYALLAREFCPRTFWSCNFSFD